MTEQTQPSQEGSNSNSSQKSEVNLGKRVLYMIFFAVALRIAEVVVFLVMVAQIIAKAATKQPIDSLTEFGEKLSRYVAQIVRFQTFNGDDLPYPFGAWPRGQGTQDSSNLSSENRQQPGPA